MANESSVNSNEQFLATIAGWDVIKQARAALGGGRVLSSNGTPPVLKGVIQEGTTSYRAGLVIKDSINIDNLCTCRAAKAWGTMCVHSIAVGLHHLQGSGPAAPQSVAAPKPTVPGQGMAPTQVFKRVKRADNGFEAEITLILPPNLAQALGKGKVMLYAEGSWNKGRTPLNTLVAAGEFAFDLDDLRLLEALEAAAGDTPGMLMVSAAELGKLLRAAVGHPRVTLGKNQAVTISGEPLRLKLGAKLESNGEILLKLEESLNADSLVKGATET